MRTTHAIAKPILLHQVLLADAAITGVTALAMLLAAPALSSLTQLPVDLLRTVGFLLLPFVAWAAWLSRAPTRRAGWAIAAINVVYGIDCLILLASGWVTPTALGVAFVLIQAVAVFTFAAIAAMALGLRAGRSGASGAA